MYFEVHISSFRRKSVSGYYPVKVLRKEGPEKENLGHSYPSKFSMN
jgi:hypothetical protein